jgi:hypothetical protein
MKNAEFVALLTSNTNKTNNVRTYSGKWVIGASKLPDNVTNHIGHLVSFLQAKIDEGLICNRDTEGLLIYNFQPIIFHDKELYCNLEALIVSRHQLEMTDLKEGVPIQFFLNTVTGEVSNPTKGMMDLGLVTEDEILQEGHQPIVYGTFMDHPALCGFIALSCIEPLDLTGLFDGHLDKTPLMLLCRAYDSVNEAEAANEKEGNLFRYVGELIYPKEELAKHQEIGIGHQILKVIEVSGKAVHVTPNPTVKKKEAHKKDEIDKLHRPWKNPLTNADNGTHK